MSDLEGSGLERLSKDTYGIWQGGRYATHQDVAGLFYTRSVDLYLRKTAASSVWSCRTAPCRQANTPSGAIGTLEGPVREGAVLPIDFTFKPAWDLERH